MKTDEVLKLLNETADKFTELNLQEHYKNNDLGLLAVKNFESALNALITYISIETTMNDIYHKLIRLLSDER